MSRTRGAVPSGNTISIRRSVRVAASPVEALVEPRALLAARILQGIGAALIVGCGPALATTLFDEALRARALAA